MEKSVRKYQTACGVLCSFLASLAVACGGSVERAPGDSSPSAAGGAGAGGMPIDMSAAGEAGRGVGAGGASVAPGDACKKMHDAPPGPAIEQLAQHGSGACAATTLADAIAQVHSLRPDLSDITELLMPDNGPGGGGSLIEAFAEPDGGFALIFQRGSGDCPTGCTTNDYWYFETDASCQVQPVGETHDSGPCTPADQQPRWGVPAAVAPRDLCGADQSLVDLTGIYKIVTCGSSMTCALPGEAQLAQPLPSSLSLRLEQDPADLSEGTVMLEGTGEPLLDGKTFPATFGRETFSVNAGASNLPAACIDQWQFELDYDFEGFGPRQLRLFQLRTPDCEDAPSAYCKGGANAELGDAARLDE